jgi:ElaB/YqjD/DUF883 family membrane-anchored ribosome-binding protein
MKTVHHPTRHAHGENNQNTFTDDLEGLKNNFAQLRSDVSELMQSAVHMSKSGAAAVQDGAGKAVEGITETISDGITGLKKTSQQTVKSISRQIADNPVTSTMLAVGAGYILARFLRGRK